MIAITVLRARRSSHVAAVLALALAAWGCDGGGDGGGGSEAELASINACAADGAPEPPKKACDSSKDVYSECPLPPSEKREEIGGSTVFYYSDPICHGGFCQYCSTSTYVEDPNATGAP
jgi:hypothetical protein